MQHSFFHERKPPAVKLDADLEFVLRITFGTSLDGISPPPSIAAARGWARRLRIDDRFSQKLATVHSKEPLDATANSEFDATLQALKEASSARLEVLAHLATAVLDAGIEVILIRQAALYAGDSEGWGSQTDINVLVQELDIKALTLALIRAGCSTELRLHHARQFSAAGARNAVFAGHQGAAVVLHSQLRFLRTATAGDFIDLATLKRCGQLTREASTPTNVWLPSKVVRAADLVGQSLIEQRFAPEFNAFGALLEAQHLGLDTDEGLASDVRLMLQSDVAPAEFEAMRELVRVLSQGDVRLLSKPARTLLNHAIAAVAAPSYRTRLQLQRKAQSWQR